MSEQDNFFPYEGDVFRAFSTAYPTQELMDDLTEAPKEREILKSLYYTEEEPSEMDRLGRILSRSTREFIQSEIAAKFRPENWYKSRYSDGSWAVLYTAEAANTARMESLHHKRRFLAEELTQGPVQIDLRIVRLFAKSERCIDLNRFSGVDHTQLISKDESGYPYCQGLAKKFREGGAELLQAPSARDPGGTSVPIFERGAIQKDYGHLGYLKCILTAGTAEVFQKKD